MTAGALRMHPEDFHAARACAFPRIAQLANIHVQPGVLSPG